MPFQTGQTYCHLDLNEVKYDNNKPSTAEKENDNVRTSANIFSD